MGLQDRLDFLGNDYFPAVGRGRGTACTLDVIQIFVSDDFRVLGGSHVMLQFVFKKTLCAQRLHVGSN